MSIPRGEIMSSTQSENTVSTLSSTLASQEHGDLCIYSLGDTSLTTTAPRSAVFQRRDTSIHSSEERDTGGCSRPMRVPSQLSNDSSLKEFDGDDNSDDVSMFKTMRKSTQRFQQSNENMCLHRASLFSKNSHRSSSPNFAQAPISRIGQNVDNFHSECKIRSPVTRSSNLKKFLSDPNIFSGYDGVDGQDKTPRRKNTSHRRSFSFWDMFNCGID